VKVADDFPRPNEYTTNDEKNRPTVIPMATCTIRKPVRGAAKLPPVNIIRGHKGSE
jgi:hypothetical protein